MTWIIGYLLAAYPLLLPYSNIINISSYDYLC
jgi:hypothetical protein